jgi:hypothetical protein
VTDRPPDPFRPGEVPDGGRAGRNAAVVLGVALLVLLAVVVVWAIAR